MRWALAVIGVAILCWWRRLRSWWRPPVMDGAIEAERRRMALGTVTRLDALRQVEGTKYVRRRHE